MEDAIIQREADPAQEASAPRRIPRRPKRIRGLPMRVRLALAMVLCVLLVLCRILWPEGAAELRRWVVGDGSEQIQQAFFRMEEALGEGDSLGEVWTAFCTELTDAPA